MKKYVIACAALLGLCVSAVAGTYTKVTADPGNWSGDYLIVYENDAKGYVMDGSRTALDAEMNYKEVDLSAGKIEGDYDACLFTITPKSGLYSIKSASGYYIGAAGTKNQLATNTSDIYSNAVTWLTDHTQIESDKETFLVYNTSGKRFRFYGAESTNTQLYKKEGDSATNPAASVTLNASSLTRNQYERFALQATVVAKDASKPCTDVTKWTSSNTSVATVDATGVVTTLTAGSTTITAKAGDCSAACTITVKAVGGYVLTFPALDAQKPVSTYNQTWTAEMCTLTWTLVNFNNYNNNWNYVRAQASTQMATISSSELTKTVTGIAITLDAVSSNVSLTLVGADDAELTENTAIYPMTLPDGAGVATANVEPHKFLQLQVTIPTNPGGKEIKISRIELMTGGAQPTTPDRVTGVSLNKTAIEIEEEATSTITANVLPSTAADKSLTWTSSDASVATVADGLVTAVKAGKAVITVTTKDGGYTATCNVTVKAKTTPDPGPGPDPKPEDDPEGTPYTAMFTNGDWANAAGLWEKVKSGGGYSNQGVQISTGYSGAGVISTDEYAVVNGVRLTYCTNASNGYGKLQVKVGENTVHEVELTSAGGTTLRNVTIPITPAEAGKIKVTIACSTNSIYVNSLTVFGTKKEKETPTPPTEGVSGKKYAIVKTAPANWKGTYLIYCPTKSVAMNGAVESSSIASNAGLSITEPYLLGDTIYATPAMDDAAFLIDSYDGQYSIRSVKNSYYLGVLTTSSSGLNSLTSEPGETNKVSIAMASDNNVTITAVNNGKHPALQYNMSGPFFRFYNSAQASVQLYRLVGEEVEKVQLTEITLNESELTLETEGGITSATLTVTYTPSNADITSLVWTSSNEAVASVYNGVVTAKTAGEATITATAVSLGKEYKATCTVTVKTYDPFEGKETYKKVTSLDQLLSGDTVILVCEAQRRANGDWEATTAPQGRLTSEEVTVQKGECYSTYAQDIRLEKEGTAWKMIIRYYGDEPLLGEEKALRCSAVKSLEVKGEGCQTWNISITEGNAVITSTKSGNDFGSLQYNSGAKVFSMYSTEQQAIQLYRKPSAPAPTAVEQVTILNNGIRYNILGQPVDETYHGIVILNGNKRLQ